MTEVCKGYKRTDIGEIPIEWEVKRIMDIAEVFRGASPRPKGDPRYYGGNVPRLMVADVTRDYKYVTPSIDFLTEAGAKLSRPTPAGSLVVVCSGTVGVPAILAVDACIHDGFLGLKNISNECDKEFLFYCFSLLRTKFDSAATHGGIFTNLTTAIMNEFTVALPPIREQRGIVAILLSIDEAIEKTEAIIEQTEKVKKGLMQQLLTKGIGHTKFKKTEIGEIPQEWEVKTLGTIGTWSGGGTPSKQEPSYWSKEKQVIWVSPKDMYSNIITSSEDYITEKGLREKKLKLLPKGTILFVTRSGILRNRVPIALAGDSLTINQDLKALQVASNIDYDFIFYTLLAQNDSIRTSCVKTGTTVESIDFQSLQEFLIPVPTLSEQKEIVKIIGTYYKKLENEKGYLEYLGSLKKGLMQLLLTGKVRVKVDEAEVTQV